MHYETKIQELQDSIVRLELALGLSSDTDTSCLGRVTNLETKYQGWNDLTATFAGAKSAGTKLPEWKDMGNGLYAYEFSNNDEVFVSFHILHDIEVGSKMYPHIHWAPTVDMVVGETISFTCKFVSPKGHHQGEVFTGTASTMVLDYTADGTELAGEHMVLECTDLQAIDALEPDSVLYASISYGDGIYGSPVWGIQSDLHYKVDGLGTPSKEPDFYT